MFDDLRDDPRVQLWKELGQRCLIENRESKCRLKRGQHVARFIARKQRGAPVADHAGDVFLREVHPSALDEERIESLLFVFLHTFLLWLIYLHHNTSD